MLKLSRNIGQALMIGDDIRLTVMSVRDDNVSIGIVAPDEVTITREELLVGGKEYTIIAGDLNHTTGNLEDALSWARGQMARMDGGTLEIQVERKEPQHEVSNRTRTRTP